MATKLETIKDELSEIKVMIKELKLLTEIMNKQIKDLEANLSKEPIKQPLFTDADLRELAQMKKK